MPGGGGAAAANKSAWRGRGGGQEGARKVSEGRASGSKCRMQRGERWMLDIITRTVQLLEALLLLHAGIRKLLEEGEE